MIRKQSRFFVLFIFLLILSNASLSFGQTPNSVYEIPKDPTVKNDTPQSEQKTSGNNQTKLIVASGAMLFLVVGGFLAIKIFKQKDSKHYSLAGFVEASPQDTLINLKQAFENGFISQKEYQEQVKSLTEKILDN